MHHNYKKPILIEPLLQFTMATVDVKRSVYVTPLQLEILMHIYASINIFLEIKTKESNGYSGKEHRTGMSENCCSSKRASLNVVFAVYFILNHTLLQLKTAGILLNLKLIL